MCQPPKTSLGSPDRKSVPPYNNKAKAKHSTLGYDKTHYYKPKMIAMKNPCYN
jgi:hypothetical protein